MIYVQEITYFFIIYIQYQEKHITDTFPVKCKNCHSNNDGDVQYHRHYLLRGKDVKNSSRSLVSVCLKGHYVVWGEF